MHIGFIMDGNRRYGVKQNVSVKEAYKKGMEKFLEFVSLQIKYRVDETSFFALSNDNYNKRPEDEKDILADLIKAFSENEKIKEFFISNKVKIRVVGDMKQIERKDKKKFSVMNTSVKKLMTMIDKWNSENETHDFKANLVINYDGQKEIVHAVKNIVSEVEKGNIKKADINEKLIKKNIWFNESQPPEIIVRSGDAPRLSGFMLWDSEYSEIYLTKKLWPELEEIDFLQILDWFKMINRNFGE